MEPAQTSTGSDSRRGRGSLALLAAILGVVSIAAGVILFGPSRSNPSIVVYCAQDVVYAEPVLKSFERLTGIRVRTVYDNEAVKTTGLANRLVAEQAHPVCDLFWGNEEMRTRQLAERGVFERWAAFGYRTRRIVVNTNLVAAADRPRSLLELTNRLWQGKVAMAYPQFGTTGTHFHALRQRWGEAAWRQWLQDLVTNRAMLVDGNSVVVKLVAKGEAWIGLTDSDDISAAQREGLPLLALEVGPETLFIPNTVAIVKGRPQTDPVHRFFDYLQAPAVVERLVQANALEGVNAPRGEGLTVDWRALLRDLEPATADLNGVFLRK